MVQSSRKEKRFSNLWKSAAVIAAILSVHHCGAQAPKAKAVEANPVSAAHADTLVQPMKIVEQRTDGSKTEINPLTGYYKQWDTKGVLRIEGKVAKGTPKDYRDSVWKYYNEAGLLMLMETYTKEGKINQRDFTYFTNNKPLSESYQYYEGDYKDTASFKFHTIEKLFYTNGQVFSEKHTINEKVVEVKCWDSKGQPQPLEYMNTVKSVYVENK